MIQDVLSVLVAVWIAELLAVLVLLLWPEREKHPAPLVPDFVPDDWTGGDRKAMTDR